MKYSQTGGLEFIKHKVPFYKVWPKFNTTKESWKKQRRIVSIVDDDFVTIGFMAIVFPLIFPFSIIGLVLTIFIDLFLWVKNS